VRAERLERAARLLARSSESVSGVAARCGCADHGHLTRTFRRAHGLTPSAYRAALG
jgi:AraC family transcriptional regulator